MNGLKLEQFFIEQMNYLTDKSLHVKDILQSKFKKILICAPLGFGKTRNIYLLRKFIEIPINEEDGSIINKQHSSYYSGIKNKLLISQDKEFFQNNFGTYPVLPLNFKITYGTTFQKIVDHFRISVNMAFIKCRYLLTSTKLNDEEIKKFKKYYCPWWSNHLYKTELVEGLKHLLKCLYKHFNNKKVFLLIDSYDYPVEYAIENDIDVNNVKKHLNQILSGTLQSEYVERAVLMGYSPDYLQNFNDIKIFNFSDDHQLVNYLGLTQCEFDNYFVKYKIPAELKELFIKKFKPYITKNGDRLYSPEPLYYLIVKKKNPFDVDFSNTPSFSLIYKKYKPLLLRFIQSN